MTAPATSQNNNKGILTALLIIPVAVGLWLLLWSFGFIASIVAFVVAYGAIWLYKVASSGRNPSKRDTYLLIAVIAAAVILSFVSGIVADAWAGYSEVVGSEADFFGEDFQSILWPILGDATIWSDYMPDLVISLVFAVLGAGSVVKDLVKPSTDKEKTKQ